MHFIYVISLISCYILLIVGGSIGDAGIGIISKSIEINQNISAFYICIFKNWLNKDNKK